MIVGIDPGITTGIAILDFNGNIIATLKKRDMKKSDIIKFISKYGKVVLVASDVNPMPKKVSGLARSLNCRTYFPETPLSNEEKFEIVREYKIESEHERDALVAAIKALKYYREILNKIKIALKKKSFEDLFDEVVVKILSRRTDNIEDAIFQVINEKIKYGQR